MTNETPRGRFRDKVALVTGGASGIGLSIARRLLDEGADVVCADVNKASLDAAKASLGERLICVETDVTVEGSVQETLTGIAKRFGRLDCAFNVAGSSRPGYVVDIVEADWDFTVDLCLKGTFHCVKHQGRLMLQHQSGAIVNVVSLNAHIPMHAGAAYASAKAGAEMLTKNAALEFAPLGVRVNAILPGLVETPLTQSHIQKAGVLEAFKQRIPAGHPGQPDDIAFPALFLATDEARYISGVSLIVDGGWHLSTYPDMRPFRKSPIWSPGGEPSVDR